MLPEESLTTVAATAKSYDKATSKFALMLPGRGGDQMVDKLESDQALQGHILIVHVYFQEI
jgi:hypothetical protein